MHVLIIGERADARMVLRRVLERLNMGLCLHEFDDPNAAMAFTESTPPDGVLIDSLGDGAEALEFVTRFRVRTSHRDVPMVVFAAVDHSAVREAALRAGLIDIVVKPIVPRLLFTRCESLLQYRREAMLVRKHNASLEDRLAWALRNLDERERELVLRGY